MPKGVVCLISALQFHELTLQMPSEVWMAIDRTAWRPRIEYPPVRFVRFSGPALTNGVKRHRIEGVEVAITDAADPSWTASVIAARSGSMWPWKVCARACDSAKSQAINSGGSRRKCGFGQF